jgi:transcriptional regulator with GAF, ATPase, and Fis domain
MSALSNLVGLPRPAPGRLVVERLVADLAEVFAAAEPTSLGEVIADTLRRIGGALDLDAAFVWHAISPIRANTATYHWARPRLRMPVDGLQFVRVPWIRSRLEAGIVACFADVDELPDSVDRASVRKSGWASCAVFPLRRDTLKGFSAAAFGSFTRAQEWSPSILELLRSACGLIALALTSKDTDDALHAARCEIRRLRMRLTEGNDCVRRGIPPDRTTSRLLSESPAFHRVIAQVDQVASTTATVLLLGETGSGKAVLAQAIHDRSPRHRRPMVTVHCAAIPGALLESELFGHERGAYTDALARQIGRFEAANQSTLFLDEIGELPLDMQVKLLRVLQERVIERLGSTQAIKLDVRIIAATNRNLERAVEEGKFREDLFYRLNVLPIVVPPLRERVEDIPTLVWSFVDEFSEAFGKPIETISKESLENLKRYSWPGNIRELRNVIERAVILSGGRHLVVRTPQPAWQPPQSAATLATVRIQHIRKVLESTNWRIRGSGGAAERLGLKPTTLESRMERLGIIRKTA